MIEKHFNSEFKFSYIIKCKSRIKTFKNVSCLFFLASIIETALRKWELNTEKDTSLKKQKSKHRAKGKEVSR